MTNRKQPEIRFEGFMEDWEQNILSEIADMNARIGWQNLRTTEFLDTGDYMLITGTDFKNGKVDYSKVHYIEKERYEQDKKIQIKNESILITKDGTLGKVAYVERLPKPATLNAGVFNVRVKNSDKVDNIFLFHYLKAPFLLQYANAQSTGGTIKHLNKNVLINFPVPLPLINEQQKIGTFFKQLDDKIALQERRIELLKKQKKGFLQKMFPKTGEKTPEVRFVGFSEDWEERELDDVLTERKIERAQSDEYPLVSFTVERGVTPKTERYEREQLVVGNAKTKKYKITELDDIVYNPANLKFGAISRNKYGKAVFSPIYVTFMVNNSITCPTFIEMFVTRNDFIKMSLKYQQGTVYERQAVSPENFLSMPFLSPSKTEQQKIGTFFKHLDDIIALNEKELALLSETKKGFLQKMFV